ncbi:CoA-binding protein [Candidatus Micrarchaeota archaeon]|nr:CoA-binding protein [Candidatus Micrarchaeota archaeon]
MDEIQKILKDSKVIAVVGLSDKPERPSYEVATYLMEHGYKIIPINPMIKEWKGMISYSSLLEVSEKIDVVDIFRKSEDVLPVVEQAIEIKAKVVWMQLGVVNEEAAEKARKAGLAVVMDKCMKIEHSKAIA